MTDPSDDHASSEPAWLKGKRQREEAALHLAHYRAEKRIRDEAAMQAADDADDERDRQAWGNLCDDV